MRLFELVVYASCAVPALVIYGLREWLGDKHDTWTLFVLGVLVGVALGLALHMVGIYVDRAT